MSRFTTLGETYQNGASFARYMGIFEQLFCFNDILQECINEELVPFCYIGAFNKEDNQIIIYVKDNQVHHIIRSLSQHILNHFYNKGYQFDSVLVKCSTVETKKIRNDEPRIARKALDPKIKEQFIKIIKIFGRDDLIETLEAREHQDPSKAQSSHENEIEF